MEMEGLGAVIGRGSYGFVVLIGGHPKIAAKYMIKDSTNENSLFEKEQRALEKLRHPNIVQYYGFLSEGLYNIIRMEYCERNSLLQVMNDSTIIYSMKTVFCWAEHLFAALSCLKEINIVHRDIKPGNVLVKDNFILKLADFGCVRDMTSSKAASIVGTYRYMSPEASGCIGIPQVNFKSDLYSTGLILWEIIERRTVYENYGNKEFNLYDLVNALKNGSYSLEGPKCVQTKLSHLICRCTNYAAEKRPETQEAYELVRKMNEDFNQGDFFPLISPNQTRRLKPTGSDGTEQLIPAEESLGLTETLFRICVSSSRSEIQDLKHPEPDKEIENLSLSEEDSTLSLSLDEALTLLKTSIEEKGIQIKRPAKERMEDYVQIPTNYLFMVDQGPNTCQSIYLTEDDLVAGVEGLDVTIRRLLKHCRTLFESTLEDLIEGYFKFFVCLQRVLVMPYWSDKQEQAYQINSCMEDLLELSDIKKGLESNPFYKQWFRLLYSKPRKYSFYFPPDSGLLYFGRGKRIFIFDPSRFKISIVNREIHEKFPDLQGKFPEEEDSLNGFHIEMILEMVKSRLLMISEQRKGVWEILPEALDELIKDSKILPFIDYRFELEFDLREDEVFEKTEVESRIIDEYEKLRAAFASAFMSLLWLDLMNNCATRSIPDPKRLDEFEQSVTELEKEYDCPNYFFFYFLKSQEEILVLNSPFKDRETVMTTTRTLDRVTYSEIAESDINDGSYNLAIILKVDLIKKLKARIHHMRTSPLHPYFS